MKNWIRQVREKTELSQEAFGELLGYSGRIQVARLETGKAQPTRALRTLLECLDMYPEAMVALLETRHRRKTKWGAWIIEVCEKVFMSGLDLRYMEDDKLHQRRIEARNTLATLVGVTPEEMIRYEADRSKPEAPFRTLIECLAKDPQGMLVMLKRRRKKAKLKA